MSISQGLWGDVWFWEGDFMPVCPDGRVDGVSREVVIFAPASPARVVAGAVTELRADITYLSSW